MSENRIAIIGGGKIGEALLAGLINGGHPVRDLVVAEKVAATAKYLESEYGVRVTSVTDAVDGAALVVVAVKPGDVEAVLPAIAAVEDFREDERVVVSLVAGIPTVVYENALSAGSPVVRAMPNTPMLVGEAMSAVAAGRYATEEQVAAVVKMLRTVGKVVVCPEAQMDAVTALSGSGPAYAFFLAEALIDAGVNLGMTRALATELVGQTIRGSGVLLTDSGLSPVELRAAVTSPAGTTSEAHVELERYGVRHAFAEAVRAAARRSAELKSEVLERVESRHGGQTLGASSGN